MSVGTLAPARRAPGSFRDPQGFVVLDGEHAYRALVAPLATFPDTWLADGPLRRLYADGDLWPAEPCRLDEVPATVRATAPDCRAFLRHPLLPVVTYPYEWPFELLRRAALLHLDVHLEALAHGLTLADGSAYNVQYVGSRPVFVDALALVPHVESEPWAGYAQFCRQFLNPLLLEAAGGDDTRDAYRGGLDGVSTVDTARRLGALGALRRRAFVHVTVQAWADRRVAAGAGGGAPRATRAGLEMLLKDLRSVVARLPAPVAASDWKRYETDNSYAPGERDAKHQCIAEAVARLDPRRIVDAGCNSGEYAAEALRHCRATVVGLERDTGAVHAAVARADALGGRLLPLQVDVTRPSPAQGFALDERASLPARLDADFLLALELVHHLVLTAGVPVERVLAFLVSLAPRGLVEFVPVDDPMARRLDAGRRLVHAYDRERFVAALASLATIERSTVLTRTGRELFEFRRS